MGEYNAFDILGPIMVGPSSSHTAGACRIAQMARMITAEGFNEVEFELHGSFAKTYKGHGTDKALLAGVMNIGPDDDRLRHSFEIADERNLTYSFVASDLGDVHPNTAKINFKYPDGSTYSVTGSSIGGGNVVIIDINGINVQFMGKKPTLILKYIDTIGIIGYTATILAEKGYNIESVYTVNDNNLVTLIIELNKNIGNDIDDLIIHNDKYQFAKFIRVD
ncbi:MAG: L-serine ammonia-lyase, iron-sulfur-dependent subunit beta [Finegoldia sp.]|nr:L-serine ammonia-lyase, iron-sulfur-dependent subunit beta [Finegoldia sp.]